MIRSKSQFRKRLAAVVPAFSLFLLLSGCYALCPENPGPDPVFEARLTEFRHSLYPDLLQDEKVPEVLKQRVENFSIQYRTELRQYRLDWLRRASRIHIDLDAFVEDPLSPNMLERAEAPRKNFPSGWTLLDPFTQIYDSAPSLLVNESMPVSTITRLMNGWTLAGPLFEARPLSERHWEILADYHTQLFRYDFDVETGSLELKKVYRRKE